MVGTIEKSDTGFNLISVLVFFAESDVKELWTTQDHPLIDK